MAVNSIITHTQDLNGQLTVIPLRHVLATGDQLGDRFEIKVLRGGKPVDLSSSGVNGYFIRPDKKTVTLIGSASSNVASVTLEESCYVEPGQFKLVIKVSMGDVRHAVYACIGTVARSSTNDLIDPGHNIPDIDELLAMIARIENVTTEAGRATQKANASAERADASIQSVDTAVSNANAARDRANTAAEQANNARDNANGSAQNANASAKYIREVTVSSEKVPPGGQPTATKSEINGHLHITFGSVTGDKGDTGSTPNIIIGKVEDLPPYGKAYATMTGTPEKPILNLGLKQGATGSIDNLLVNGKASQNGRIDLSASDIPGVRAVNLLDNSDFRHPINQRLKTSYAGSGVYGIDRWMFTGTQATMTVGDTGISFAFSSGTLYLVQRFLLNALDANRTYSAYLYDANGNVTKGSVTRYNALVEVAFTVVSGRVYTHAVLYEGDLAAADLPPYQPKGYAVELMECYRYFYHAPTAGSGLGYGYITGGNLGRVFVSLPVPMINGTPTVTIPGGFNAYVDGVSINYATVEAAYSYFGILRINLGTPSTNIGKAVSCTFYGTGDIDVSAEL